MKKRFKEGKGDEERLVKKDLKKLLNQLKI
jgi:hypothetical protein